MKGQRFVKQDHASGSLFSNSAEMTYDCNLCGRKEAGVIVDAAKVPIMLGVRMEHDEPPSIEFVNPKASDVHVCHRCLRCMQVTFRTPADTVVLRNGR